MPHAVVDPAARGRNHLSSARNARRLIDAATGKDENRDEDESSKHGVILHALCNRVKNYFARNVRFMDNKKPRFRGQCIVDNCRTYLCR